MPAEGGDGDDVVDAAEAAGGELGVDFEAAEGAVVGAEEADAIEAGFLKAYRWQYVYSGAAHPMFKKVLTSLITEDQAKRIESALAAL